MSYTFNWKSIFVIMFKPQNLMYCLCGRWVLVSLFKIVRLKSAAVWPEVHVQIDNIAVVGGKSRTVWSQRSTLLSQWSPLLSHLGCCQCSELNQFYIMYCAFLRDIQRRVILNKETVRPFFPQNKNKQSIHTVLETCIRGLSSDVVRNRRMY